MEVCGYPHKRLRLRKDVVKNENEEELKIKERNEDEEKKDEDEGVEGGGGRRVGNVVGAGTQQDRGRRVQAHLLVPFRIADRVLQKVDIYRNISYIDMNQYEYVICYDYIHMNICS
jgi:hypothetical protein